jgi:hypothetical protein
MSQLRLIANNLQVKNVKIDLNTGDVDKLYLVAGGAIYEIPIPESGNLDGEIADGKFIKIHCTETHRIPGRSRKR